MTALAQAFQEQATACADLGSPFMARLCTLLAEPWPETGVLARRTAAFEGSLGPSGASLPLRIAGGLHALVLQGQNPALAAVYPPNDPDDATLKAAVFGALSRHNAALAHWIETPTQTNEIRRSAALIAGGHVAAHHHPMPIRLLELGASGGLNLHWDAYALDLPSLRLGPTTSPVILRPDWAGAPPPQSTVTVAHRRGVDLNPLDPRDPGDLLRLCAYLWPDQPHRIEMTRAAAGLTLGAVDRGDAIDWLEGQLGTRAEGTLTLIQNTIAWQYLPAAAQTRGAALIAEAGARATRSAPLGWLQMEADDSGERGAAVRLHLWPEDRELMLGRADFHGRWVHWFGT